MELGKVEGDEAGGGRSRDLLAASGVEIGHRHKV
jgi:hypothetical protein